MKEIVAVIFVGMCLLAVSALLFGPAIILRLDATERPPAPAQRIETVRHAGHDYLRFFDLGGVSVVHDPECECGR